MSQSVQFVSAADFKARSREVVSNPHLRKSFRGAMDYLMTRRAAQFESPEVFASMRATGEAIRQYSLAHLPDLLEKLESRLTSLGVQVHYAENADQANQIFLAIAQQHQATRLIKGKSMVSEEIELNHEMARHGVNCLESDMGEYIVQLAGERPSHIIMPAIHKTKQDIAKLFAEQIPNTPYTEDVDELIRIGRNILRTEFMEADIGVSGANFLVAETGSIVLVENEGNGRMCTTVPPVHIAITGIEKIVERLDHVPPLFSLLTRSATGQATTTYLNIITGPRREGEKDGPKELHLILLDNGRTQAYQHESYRASLQCIRCGACMNHCPVYTRVGGLTYGTTYPGPIGAIISPHLQDLKVTQDLPTASSLCGACGEVCPVGIPIPDILMQLREAAQHEAHAGELPLKGQGQARGTLQSLAWKAWRIIYGNTMLYRNFLWLASRFNFLTPPVQAGWTQSRTLLKPAKNTLRDMLKKQYPH